MQSNRTARYIDVLKTPGVLSTFGAALIGRGAYALVFLPLLYAVSDTTGSVGLAGIAVGLYGAGASFLAPVRAWFIDRFGARRVLSLLIITFGCALASIGLCALYAPNGATLIVLSAVAGAVAPPLGPTMRVAWGRLASGSDMLKKGLSFDAVVEELLYLGGPAIMGLALAYIQPGAALLIPAGLVLVGGLLFVSTQVVGHMGPQSLPAAGASSEQPLIINPRFMAILLPTLAAGAISGSISVSVPIVVADAGGPAAAGIALGLFAGGSAVGGLLYGALRVPGSPFRQLVVLTGLLVAASSGIALVTGAFAVSVVLVASGLFFSPVMIVAYFAAHRAGGEHRQNSATTWVNTSHNAGAALGSAIAGIFIQVASGQVATIAIAGGAVVALLVSILLSTSGVRSQR